MMYINPDPPDEIRRQIRKRLRNPLYTPRLCLAMYRHAMRYWRESQGG